MPAASAVRTVSEYRHAFTGPIASVSTPFLRDGAIDFRGLDRFVDHVVAAGSRSVVLTFGDSLYSLLTDDEVAEVTQRVIACTAKRALVVAADRVWWTGKTVEFARYCRATGADILMVLPPDWCLGCTVQTLVEHFGRIAQEMPVMLVTNFLAKWPLPRAIELIRRLRDEVPGVVAVKDDVGGELGRQLGLLVSGKWAIFASGTKRAVLNNVPFGCDGYLSSFIYLKPEIAHAFWRAVVAGDDAAVRTIITEVDIPFWSQLENAPGSFDAAVHAILELMGLAGRWRRPPYYNFTDGEMEELAAALRDRHWL
jgi:dihydrodipicolinate synthase/N-acetylneuraminate lyase